MVPRDVAMATNFGTKFAITGFVGSNFGCMIASNTLFDSRDAESGGSRKYVLHVDVDAPWKKALLAD